MHPSASKQTFLNAFPYCVELHAHSKPVSRCSEIPAPELVDRYHALGAHAIVLTNHVFPEIKTESQADWVARYAKDFHDAKARGEAVGVQVLLGLEVRFPGSDNDYLVYGVDETFLPAVWNLIDTDLQTFSPVCHNSGGIILQAHPFRNGMTLSDPVHLDGIEVFNMHPGHNSRVAVAAIHHAATGGIITGGTDFHHPGHEGKLFTCFPELPRDSAHLATLLKSGNYIFRTGNALILP